MAKTKEIAADTVDILERGYYTGSNGSRIDLRDRLSQSIEQTRLYRPAELDALLEQDYAASYPTVFEVMNETTLDSLRRISAAPGANIMCLNFASARNPGGGFLSGAVAQEESIARSSGLYPTLLTAMDYYHHHRKLDTCLYTDHMIYSPGVPVFKLEDGQLMDQPVYTAVITSPATNAGAIRRNEPANEAQIIPVMKTRTEKVLGLSLYHGLDTLILGAWGCGVFQNDPETIAALFHDALTGKFSGKFKKVVFAVYTRNDAIIAPFRNRFA